MNGNLKFCRHLISFALLAVLVSLSACSRSDEKPGAVQLIQSTPIAADLTDVGKWPSTTPEDVARKFTFATMIGDEKAILATIRTNEKASILWTAGELPTKDQQPGLAQRIRTMEFRCAVPGEELPFLNEKFHVPADVGDDHKVLVQINHNDSKSDPGLFVDLVREKSEWKVDASEFIDSRLKVQAVKDRANRVNPEHKKQCEQMIADISELTEILKAIQDRASAEKLGPKLKASYLNMMEHAKEAKKQQLNLPLEENALFNTSLGPKLVEVTNLFASELERVVKDKELNEAISPFVPDVDVEAPLNK